MKNTVFTVMTVLLLMATLCLPAAAQTWVLDNWYSGPDDDRVGHEIHDIEFRDNHQVFFGKYDRLYKWDLNQNWLWWHDFSGDKVSHVEVPRGDSTVVIHTVDDRGHIAIRDADDLSRITYRGYLSASRWWEYANFLSLDVDRGGYFVIYQVVGGTFGGLGNAGVVGGAISYEVAVRKTWDGGWTLSHETGDDFQSVEGDLIMHPDYDTSSPRFYRQAYPSAAHFSERTGSWGNVTDTYEAPADHFDRLAITNRYGSANDTVRIAALAYDNDIHVWNYGGDLLFTLNEWENYSAHDNILEFTNNGELLVTAFGRWVRFWDVGARAEDHSFWVDAMDDDESIKSLEFSDNGMLMALGSSKGTAYIYRWTGGNAPVAPAKETEAQPTALLSNYPNPFNPETWIPYQLSEAAEVTVTIHSSDGKLVRTLELGQMPAGAYSDKDRAAYWDGRNAQGEPVASGVYFYTLTAGDFSATRKIVIRK